MTPIKLCQENDHERILSYNCQKNLVLQKIPAQKAYFHQQLYYIILLYVRMCQQIVKTKTIHFVMCGQKISILNGHCKQLQHYNLGYLPIQDTVQILRESPYFGFSLMAGQNKNKTVIYMLSFWLLLEAPPQLKRIILFSNFWSFFHSTRPSF